MSFIRSIAKLAGTVLLVLAAFILVGVFAPEVELSSEITIEVEPLKVFEALIDTNQMKLWMVDFHTLRIENADRLNAGINFVLTLNEKEALTRIEGVMTGYNSPERLEFFFKRTEADGTMLIQIERIGDHSRVTYRMKPIGTDVFSRSALPIIQIALQSDLEKRFLDLKKYLEN